MPSTFGAFGDAAAEISDEVKGQHLHCFLDALANTKSLFELWGSEKEKALTAIIPRWPGAHHLLQHELWYGDTTLSALLTKQFAQVIHSKLPDSMSEIPKINYLLRVASFFADLGKLYTKTRYLENDKNLRAVIFGGHDKKSIGLLQDTFGHDAISRYLPYETRSGGNLLIRH
jgi:hypothetical protein